MAAKQPASIPILTDAIPERIGGDDSPLSPLATEAVLGAADSGTQESSAADAETLIVELQTRIAADAYELTDEIVREALAEIEARLHRQISSRLRRELPELIDSLLRERLELDREE